MLMVNFMTDATSNRIKETFKGGDFLNADYFYKNEFSLQIYRTLFFEDQTKVEKKNESNI